MLGEDGPADVAVPHTSRFGARDPSVPQCGGAALQGLCGPEDAQVLPKGHRLAAPAPRARGPTRVHCQL